MKSTLLFSGIAGLFAACVALAQSVPVAPADRAAQAGRHFSQLDKNGDGMIGRDEAAGRKWLAKQFDRIDSDKDSRLSKEEMQAHREAMRNRHMAKLEERFKAADKDGDQALTRTEVEASKMPRLLKHFDRTDANKDGTLSMEELQASRTAMHRAHRERHAKRLSERFKSADSNGDGALTKAEAEAGKLPRVARNFDQADADQDGKVTISELQAGIGRHRH
jgi:Ca2+-binding EF-hand superfamily protein